MEDRFILRTTKQMWTIREDPAVREYLTRTKTRLSSTASTTEKRHECIFVYGAHVDCTKRDDVRKAIKTYLGDTPSRYSVFPGWHSNGKVYYRVLLIDVAAEDYDAEYDRVSAAFNAAREAKDPIL